MTYAEYRAGAIALAQSVDWGSPPRPGQKWPRRLLDRKLAAYLLGTCVLEEGNKHNAVLMDHRQIQCDDNFQLRGYFAAKEKNQDRNKLK